jgi:hypothetical protein
MNMIYVVFGARANGGNQVSSHHLFLLVRALPGSKMNPLTLSV